MTKLPHNFRCVIVSPAGKLLDCESGSVTFIAHDGSMGVLYNHMPMLCELGLGIMEIVLPASENGGENNNNGNHHKIAVIDGGFALVCSNVVKIIASDAVCGWDTKREKIEQMLERSRKKLIIVNKTSPKYMHENKKNRMLEKLLATIK